MSKVERINFKKYELEALFSLKGGKMEWRFRELLRGVGSWDFFFLVSFTLVLPRSYVQQWRNFVICSMFLIQVRLFAHLLWTTSTTQLSSFG
ncbi:hypothetical protein NC653_025059 [Populus alba x Populus x berolinensis]|uniref:Uncharacterized protein n=1 Tax=Populus alba x Populus x berolinensis TaxID=444605 RepID=A0AAD6MB61_9ROSI|nr:hypothetical protein NC653_025059 [Populus alba x Populus x berolinensis]